VLLPRGGRGLGEPSEVTRHVRLVVIAAGDRDVGQRLAAGDPAQRRLEADRSRECLGRDADVHLEAPFELAQAESRARRQRPQIDRARGGRDGADGNGRNELVLAITDKAFGWGFRARLDSREGLTIVP
jgi:hypothetical protein